MSEETNGNDIKTTFQQSPCNLQPMVLKLLTQCVPKKKLTPFLVVRAIPVRCHTEPPTIGAYEWVMTPALLAFSSP